MSIRSTELNGVVIFHSGYDHTTRMAEAVRIVGLLGIRWVSKLAKSHDISYTCVRCHKDKDRFDRFS